MTARRRPHSSTTKRPQGRGGQKTFKREELTKFYGVQACLAIFEHRRADIRRVFVLDESLDRFRHVDRWCERRGVPLKVVEFEELSTVAGTDHHEGVCFEAKPLTLSTPGQIITRLTDLQRGCVVILEGVENPHNVGAILRTSCFFGVTAVIIRSAQMNSLSGAACRVAEGAAEFLPIAIVKEYGNLFNVLKARGYSIVATTPHEARSVYSVKWANKTAILFGAEGEGLSPEVMELADTRVVIPRLGQMESLNVGTAVASVLTEARRELVISGAIRRVQLAKDEE